MKKHMPKFLKRAPRILAMLFILFLSMFSLDVFGQGYTVRETIIGLFMHNIPSFVLIAILIISRKYELVGAITFMLAGLAYIVMCAINGVPRPMIIGRSTTISGPALLTGILFRLSRKRKK